MKVPTSIPSDVVDCKEDPDPYEKEDQPDYNSTSDQIESLLNKVGLPRISNSDGKQG